MGVGREIPPIPTVFEGSNARRAGRVRLSSVGCTLGEVLDLSATGLRLRAARRPDYPAGAELNVQLEGVDGPFKVRCRVAWVKRAGLRRHEVGLEFIDPDAATRRSLADLARTAPSNETFHRVQSYRRSA
jgi:hypothetical protein